MDADCACLCSTTGPNGGDFVVDGGGQEQMISLGTYPDTLLADACDKARQASPMTST
jgi:hypothetical protein